MPKSIVAVVVFVSLYSLLVSSAAGWAGHKLEEKVNVLDKTLSAI
jgi:hypothetical protein